LLNLKLRPPKGANPLDFLGVLGPIGLTAYFVSETPCTLWSNHSWFHEQGLLDVGKIKAGETLVVSGSAGATGSVVCQIGKKKGARVIAIAGGSEKCKWLKESIGVDEALDYKSPSFYKGEVVWLFGSVMHPTEHPC
jgi:NADPH-dependent curcumin reductase CurA